MGKKLRHTGSGSSLGGSITGANSIDNQTVRQKHTSDTSGRKSRENTRDQSRDSDLGNTTGSAWRKRGKHTDLNTNGGDVSETTDCVSSDEFGTSGECAIW